jgi:hypothetical protein
LYAAVGDTACGVRHDDDEEGRSGATEKGAHTFALAPAGSEVYAFLPASNRAAVYQAGHI